MLAELSLWILALLTLVGTAAGFVDTLAGGGGMLTIGTGRSTRHQQITR